MLDEDACLKYVLRLQSKCSGFEDVFSVSAQVGHDKRASLYLQRVN